MKEPDFLSHVMARLGADEQRASGHIVKSTLRCVPDGWAKLDGEWVRLVKHPAHDGDLISDYFTVED